MVRRFDADFHVIRRDPCSGVEGHAPCWVVTIVESTEATQLRSPQDFVSDLDIFEYFRPQASSGPVVKVLEYGAAVPEVLGKVPRWRSSAELPCSVPSTIGSRRPFALPAATGVRSRITPRQRPEAIAHHASQPRQALKGFSNTPLAPCTLGAWC